MKFELKVEGMVCSGCENRVKNVLLTIEGITHVEASYETGCILVDAKENVKQEIIEKISDLGFEVVDEG